MLTPSMAVRRAEERGTTKNDWLVSHHSFSFGGYRDLDHMGIGPLRVLNDDTVAPGQGFGPHAHRDMEILSIVLHGAMRHEDSHGHQGVLKAGEVQHMRAGTGVVHSEMNASATEPLRFLQVWVVPREEARKPAYEQAPVAYPTRGGWGTVASPEDSGMGGFELDADVQMMLARVPAGQKVGHVVHDGRQVYLFVAEGQVAATGEKLGQGDAGLLKGGTLGVKAQHDSLLLLFDLPR